MNIKTHFLIEKESAKLFGVVAKTLKRWRTTDPSLKFESLKSGRVQYKLKDLQKFSCLRRQPLNLESAVKSGIPFESFIGFHFRNPNDPKNRILSIRAKELQKILLISRQLKQLVDRPSLPIAPNLIRSLRTGFISDPKSIGYLAKTLAKLQTESDKARGCF